MRYLIIFLLLAAGIVSCSISNEPQVEGTYIVNGFVNWKLNADGTLDEWSEMDGGCGQWRFIGEDFHVTSGYFRAHYQGMLTPTQDGYLFETQNGFTFNLERQ